MPRRSLLSDSERDSLLTLPESQDDLIQHYSFTDADMALIRQRRGAANRLGFAVQLSLLRYPGYALASDTVIPDPVIHWIAKQVSSDAAAWPQYGERDETRREHFQELRGYLTLSTFGLPDFRKLVHSLTDLAMQTDKALILAAHALETLRQQRIILPAMSVVERACAEAVTRANRQIYRALLEPLEPHHRRGLDNLLNVAPDINVTWLVWLRQSPLGLGARSNRTGC
jgi:TnpA family transposase